MERVLAQYEFLDLLVFIAYGLVLVATGWFFNRRSLNSKDYFLGGNSMPVWVVAISVLATSQSAATFLGGPDQGYRGDLSYLSANIAAVIAALLVAAFLIPKFYQNQVYTVYQLLEKRFGEKAKQRAGAMYLFGRVFASGSRLYMAAIAVAMILFGDFQASSVIWSIVIMATIGLAYTVYGGIRTVIYSDVVQCLVYLSAAGMVLYFLFSAIPADLSTIIATLEQPSIGQGSKLAMWHFDLDFGPSGVFNFWSIMTGLILLNIAAFGLDQDMTQRVLTCKSAAEGSKAMLLSTVIVIPVIFMFICIGLLLYIYYQQPDIMQKAESLQGTPSFEGENVTIFMYYVLNEVPAGIKGLVTIGIVAAALSTLNSGLNSMASVLVQDIYRPKQEQKGKQYDDTHYVKAGQWAMVFVALALGLMACLCYYWQQHTDMPLLQFALSVMVFSYSGLLGVYFITLFSTRGSTLSVTCALVSGFLVTLFMQPYVMGLLLPEAYQFDLGFTWQLCIGTLISAVVCSLGSGNPTSETQKLEEQNGSN